MDHKSVKLVGIKAGSDDGLDEGQFTAYFSTWTRTPDSYGDVVAKGAFAETLAEWKASGNTLPILFGHDTVDPFSNIGGAIDVVEDDHGAKVTAQLDLANPKAAQVYRMLKGRRIGQLSFAFDVLEDATVELEQPKADGSPEKVTARELRKMKLYEVSVVPMGANQDTEVLAVKANVEALKSGRSISTKNLASLKSARDAIDAVITAASEVANEDTPKASLVGDVVEEQELKTASARTRSVMAVTLATISSE